MKIEEEVIHQKTIRAVIDWPELKNMAVESVLRRSGLSDRMLAAAMKRVTADVQAPASLQDPGGLLGEPRLLIIITEDLGGVVAAAEGSP